MENVGEMVLKTFVGPKPAGMECIHLDGNPNNNRLDNLVWGPPEDSVCESESK